MEIKPLNNQTMFKKIFLTMACSVISAMLYAQDVGVGTQTPNARLDVEGNKIGYDILKVSNDMFGAPDSSVFISPRGNMSLGIANPGTYRLLSFGSPAAFSPQLEVWQGDPNGGGIMLGDINDAGAGIGILGLYLGGVKTVQFSAAGNSWLNGNLGVGVTTPMESVHSSGAIILGQHTMPPGSEVAGTIEYSGGTFIGFDGTNWVSLTPQPDNDWFVGGNYAGFTELQPLIPGSSLSLVSSGPINSYALTWLTDLNFPGTFPIQLMLETDAQNSQPYDAAMMFRRSDWSAIPPPLVISENWMGIFNGDNSFMLSNAAVTVPGTQCDGATLLRSTQTGIVSMMNQSRVRATVASIDWNSWQLIQPTTWTPINFTNDGMAGMPGPAIWDRQNEFTVAALPGTPTPPVNSFFTALEEGYYQVNARCEYEPDDYYENGLVYPVYMRPNAYVSIAIYINTGSGWVSHSIGNNLQTTNNTPLSSPPGGYPDATETITNNNAPNVSDVIYLQAGWQLSIWTFHWAYTPMMLRSGDDVIYVSIHKSS